MYLKDNIRVRNRKIGIYRLKPEYDSQESETMVNSVWSKGKKLIFLNSYKRAKGYINNEKNPV